MSAGKLCVSLQNDVFSRIEGLNEGRHTYFTESPVIGQVSVSWAPQEPTWAVHTWRSFFLWFDKCQPVCATLTGAKKACQLVWQSSCQYRHHCHKKTKGTRKTLTRKTDKQKSPGQQKGSPTPTTYKIP